MNYKSPGFNTIKFHRRFYENSAIWSKFSMKIKQMNLKENGERGQLAKYLVVKLNILNYLFIPWKYQLQQN